MRGLVVGPAAAALIGLAAAGLSVPAAAATPASATTPSVVAAASAPAGDDAGAKTSERSRASESDLHAVHVGVATPRRAAVPSRSLRGATAPAVANPRIRAAARSPAGVSAALTKRASANVPALGAFAWSTPVWGTYMSSGFGRRWGRAHQGIDFAGPVGTPLRSLGWGVVTFAGPRSGYGTTVEIICWDGTVVRYGHLSKTRARAGDVVTPGERVGELGNSGQSTGPHLHLEVRQGGEAVDPLPWLYARGAMPLDVRR